MPTSLAPLRGATSQSSPEKTEATPGDLSRLPKVVKPRRYELKLDIQPEKLTYTGQVNIRIFVGDAPVNTVWVHSVRLSIDEAFIQFSQFALPVQAEKVIEVPKYGCIGIHFKEALQPETRAWLGIKFHAKISQNLEGFFSTPFIDKSGDVRMGAATMFAATEARTCFPCFDEPDLKAVFAIETTVDDDLIVISNMPVMDSRYGPVNESTGKRKRTDYFEWSKEMSTYLVCLVIGQYDSLQTVADNRTKIRVYTPWGQREQGRFALEVTKRSLEFFNNYFGKRYPLPKLDMVALSRLSVGAMENWGLITCRETGLIVDPADSTPAQLQKVATLIAHEVSHQWFGNLVTMKWWDFLYLNEGFATLMQYLCIDKIYPEFQVFNYFCTETIVPAMGMDALENSHPIEMPLKDPSEISQVFDKITYCKGAAVLFMLHQFIGAEDFKTGIQNYMQEFSYGNADTEDLWKYLSSSSRKDVGSVMNSWIRELGFPVVYVALEPPSGGERNNTVVLKMRQERFSSYNGHDRAMLWSIPLEGIYMKNGIHLEKFNIMFDKKSIDISLEGFDVNDPMCWIKINPKLTGFYRVHYCEELISRLLDNLDSPNLTAIDRMGLFDDQVAMVLSETGSTVRILKLAQKFRNYERSITVWRSVCGILHQIRTLTWPNDELADKFDQFCISILSPVLLSFGLNPGQNGEASSDAQCRALLFSHLASLGDEHVHSVANELFRHHVEGVATIPAGLREAVFKAVMVQANRSVFNQMKMLYRQAELAEEKSLILNALGYSKDPNILSLVLDFAISYEVPAQESLSTIVTVASNRHGHRIAWFFFTSNIEKILSRYSGGLFLLSRIVRAVTESFSDRDIFQEVTEFFSSYRDKMVCSAQAVQQAEEHMRLNMTWREKDIDSIRHFLDHNID